MSITQIIRGDSTGAVKAVQDFNKVLDTTAEKGKTSKKELKEMDAAARRIAEAADPQKKYNRQLEDMAKLVKIGKLEIRDAETMALRYWQQLDKVGQAGEDAFGDKAIAQLGRYAMGWASVQTAVSVATKLLDEANRVGKEAASNVMAGLNARGELQQLSPEQQSRARAFATEAIRRGIFSPEQEQMAYQMGFDLENANYSQSEKDMLLRVGETGVIRPDSLMPIGSKLRKYQDIFGQGEAGNLPLILDKLTYAANQSLSDLATVAGAVPEYAANAKALGFSDEETLASFIAVEKRSKDPAVATTNLKNLLQIFERDDLVVNNDLTDTIASIAGRVRSGEKLAGIIPDAQARAAARDLIGSQSFVNKLEKGILGSSGLINQQAGSLAESDPEFAAGLGRRKAAGELWYQRKVSGVGEEQLLFDAVADRERANIEQTQGQLSGAAVGILQGIADVLGLEGLYLRNRGKADYVNDPQTQQNIDKYLSRTAEATEQTRDTLRDLQNRKPEPRGRRE